MKFKFTWFFAAFFCLFALTTGCIKKENKNLYTHSGGRDPRVDNFFNAVGVPLKTMSGNDLEALTADLSRVSPLFTNALPPKNFENPYSAPFFTLAKNVGAYFASQIWKTQITSPNEVRFFDLGEDKKDVGSGIQYRSSDFDLPFVFLNPYADKFDSKNYLGSVDNGIYKRTKEFTGAKFDEPISHFYIMEYTLRDENGSSEHDNPDVRTYYALVSVPIDHTVDQTQQYRLIMYGHGGDYGTSSSELITVFNEKLKNFVVVAPLFPGEPLCTQISAQGKGCLRLDENMNLVKDNIGTFHNPDISVPLNSIVPINYPRSPLIEDINSFLGAHNAVARVMNLPFQGNQGKNPFYSDTLSNHSLLLALEHSEELINYFQQRDGDVSAMVPTQMAPESLVVGSSRGGVVVLAALGRIGFLMNGISLIVDSQFSHTMQQNGESVHFQYPLFSGGALFFSPTSFVTGKLRLLAMMIMQNNLESIASIPMTTDLAKNQFFTNYRNDSHYFSEIQPALLNSERGTEEPAKDSLSQLMTFVAANDITFLAPFISTGLQNWNSFYYHKNTRAPGALVLLHGSQDLVVPMTESAIAAQALNTVWAGLYHTPTDPYGNYLNEEQFNGMHQLLADGSFIPGLGVSQYTFQPTDHFFNLPCDRKLLAGIQGPDVIYNTNVGRCFGGGYSPNADGQNAEGSFYGHMDASFYTGRLVNILPEENLHLALLSSNIKTATQTDQYTIEYDGLHHIMKKGPPKYRKEEACSPDVENCFSYKIALNSPSFMRYMSAEGTQSTDILAAKKQIFEGEFKPNNPSALRPHDVFFAWLDSVACDACKASTENREPLFPEHSGVFHDFFREN